MRTIKNPKLIQKRLEDVAYEKGYNNISIFYKDIWISSATMWNWLKENNKKMKFSTQRTLEKYINLKDCIE